MTRIISLLLVGMFLISCKESHKEEVKELKYPVFFSKMKDTVYYNEYVADIYSVQHVEIRSRVSGYIDKVHVDEGRLVKKGQLLFNISDQEFKEGLMKAKAIYKSAVAESKTAELQLHNTQLLAEKNVVSQTEVEMAKAQLQAMYAKVEEAKSQMVSAELALSYTKIKAPFDGVVSRIMHKQGSLVGGGTLLTTISDNKEVFAYFNMSEKEFLDFSEYNKGPLNQNKVSLILANNKKHTVDGYVETTEGKIAKETGTIALRARFSNADNLLKHGASGKIRMIRELKNALVIPQKATIEIQDQTYVFVLDSTNTAQMQSIVPRFRLADYYVIESGLSISDRIVYEGVQAIRDGEKIDPDTLSFTQIEADLK